MYGNNLRPSGIIAQQRDVISQQEGTVETLKAAMAASGRKPTVQVVEPHRQLAMLQQRRAG